MAAGLVFTGGVLTGRGLAGSPAVEAAPAPPAPTVTVTADPPATPAAVRPVPPAAGPPAPPTRLVVPKLDIKAPVVDIDLSSDAVLEPPSDPDLVGWWTGSAEPGATQGRVVVTGHTVSTGGGALDLLPELEPGDKVVLVTATGRHRYRVTDSLFASYRDVAEHAQDIFGQTETSPAGARLILVTCTGFNGRFYAGNSIVVARPL
ncbi:class F sortase [Nocardioides rubriscoriae]|uniref:class F sortase n=1 Tax=Nocardioides rubriscoriae TaxID=642762 RepID=UPI001478C161|nr:class F sortase [Nocardioides rubriscoriae]